jgi:ketosteroid isomerase-like protein
MEAEPATHLAGQIVEALNCRDPDPYLAVVHDNFEGYSAFVEAEGGDAFRGVEGARAWFENLLEVYGRLSASLEQTVAVRDHSLHLVRLEFVGKGSGVAVDSVVGWVLEARAGRIAFMHSHLDLAEAFHEMGRRMTQPSSGA